MSLAIVKHRTSRRGHLGHLHISSIDPEGKNITILIHPPPTNEEIKLEIPFDPPVKSPYEVRPRLLAWRDLAYSHFDVPRNPVITYYSFPSPLPWLIPLLLALSALFFALLGRGDHADWFREKIEVYLGKYAVKISAVFALVTHIGESIWMSYLCRRHRIPRSATVKWIITVLSVGVAGITEFFECVEFERIRHIYARTDVGPLPPRVCATKSKTI
ncbi:hypothetical protein M231_04640 [Tremella mesenterica]|uniref:DUF2470 domain-containing protein n=1 Tax=Tremella mesenterica TaxID=5217 RepID=A0A4Q1BK04_TREME|nr:hypothetical protein M231_04640 [Tremella mesenterica]